jgi:hypothetical protein
VIKTTRHRRAKHVNCIASPRNFSPQIRREETTSVAYEDTTKFYFREIEREAVDWINLAQDRDKWWTLVRDKSSGFLKTLRNLYCNLAINSFLSRNLLYEISWLKHFYN